MTTAKTSTKMHQKVSSVLAGVGIAVLVAIIIVVWVQVGHGTFKPPNHHHRHKNNNNDSSDSAGNASRTTSFATQDYQVEKSDLTKKKEGKGLQKPSHLDDFPSTETELVKPIKIGPPPLHDHDIIYDQLHDLQDHPPLRHHSGHFRRKTAEVWDPQPRYEIRAFGRKLDLELHLNGKFVSPNLQVTRIWDNFTQKALHDPRTMGCFYTGKIEGEENSDVAVSLCNGMTGYIRTPEGNYYIEPVENFQTDVETTTSILHRIKKIPHATPLVVTNTNEIVQDLDSDECETRDRNAPEQHRHVINKRDLYFDYLDTSAEDFTENAFERRRSTRNTPRALDTNNDADDTEDEEESYEFVPTHKRTGNQEYHIEVMIVADKKMIEYHNTENDLIHYVLTLMSHVALLYKDKTIGNPISLAIVKIVILRDMEFKGMTSAEMLREFCDWQARHNKHQNHDTAILLTRESICKDSTNQQCHRLGVAEVNSMCHRNWSCGIVRDKGLSTSYTIAHELGHILSMPHDDDTKCFAYNGVGKANNIMGKVLQNGTKPWLWSACSKHFLTEFLETSRASCLLDAPHNDFITSKFASTFPGETFEVDRQCELEFGMGYKLCPYVDMPRCGSLWCTNDVEEGCKTQHMPWADGTMCGGQSWCHRGECIVQDRQLLHPIPGGWGPWQTWGSCSRTCGGGVKMARRTCDSPAPENGGAYCVGRGVKYASCNTQACDDDPNSPDFRELQCSEFDGNPRGIPGLDGGVKWVPKYGMPYPDDACKLYCRVKLSANHFLLKEKVTDGTKCGLDTYNICVNGICRSAGCDNRLESKMELDECGVCGGDNSKCEEITGTYNISKYSYNRVIRLPKGSSNIYIRQRSYGNAKADENYLALVDGETGLYVLNGNSRISPFAKDFFFGGMTITYSGSEQVVEYIKTPKNRRLSKDLVLEVLSVGKQLPPDITYRYTIRRDSAPRYGWQLYDQQWSKCNSLCSGTQYLRPVCVELSTSTRVPDNYCSDLDLNGLVQQKECNMHCKFVWNVVSRGQCSAHCGNGVRPVFYSCMKINSNRETYTNYTVVNDRHCVILPKAPEVEACTGSCDSTRWEYEEWSQCTKSCGGGTQRRNYKCVDLNGQKLVDSRCNVAQRVPEQSCNSQKCPVWSFDEWSPCSVTCGQGYRKRPYFCNVDGRTYEATACDPSTLPAVEEQCTERPCASWWTGEWNECDTTCVQARQVFCRTYDLQIVEEHRCTGMLRPNDTRLCPPEKCPPELAPYKRDFDNSVRFTAGNDYKWVTGAWTECTRRCETGTKSRQVVCRNAHGDESESECDRRKRPVQSVECNPHPCPVWNFGAWSACDSDCEQHRQVSCQDATDGHIVTDDECDPTKRPYGSTRCNTDRCIRTGGNGNGQYKWKQGKWGACSKSCGRGVKTRQVRCVNAVYQHAVVDEYCGRLRKPKTKKPCERSDCDYVWVEDSWSRCSERCGQGFKYRNVTCHRVLRGNFIDPLPLRDAARCDVHNKPPSRANCTDRRCNDFYSWSAGPWSECSQPCGKRGRQTRSLHCVGRDGKKVNRRLCLTDLRPKRKRKCNNKRCLYKSCKELKVAQGTADNRDYYLLVGERLATVYCYKMDTREPEEYISLKSERGNYAEMYDKRLREQKTCPDHGQRRDDCDCAPVTDISGHTNFWKVRLNVTSLRIIGDDFTFSRQVRGTRIQYGTAGDCYSELEGCVQGRFSIDLSETSFKLSPNVRWINWGTRASSKIHAQERTAMGTCGGYCGSCVPDPMVGLAVEVT